jgi:hypothetical protein
LHPLESATLSRRTREADIADCAVYVAIGRIARLYRTPWEGPECAPKPPFRIEREIGFTVHSRSSRYRNDLQLAYRHGTDATPPDDRAAADGDVRVEEVAARRPQPNQSSLLVRAG